jgi:hypothetical protein
MAPWLIAIFEYDENDCNDPNTNHTSSSIMDDDE